MPCNFFTNLEAVESRSRSLWKQKPLEAESLYFRVLMDCTVYSYHLTYAFQSESTLHSCLNIKELFPRNRRDIWSLSDCIGTRTHDRLVLKRTLNHLAKLDCSNQENLKKLNILTGKNCVLLNPVQEWLFGCFWRFSYVYTIK